jgi:multidrug resistance efflux pump
MRLKRRALVTGVLLLAAAAGTLWALRKRGGDSFLLSGAIEARDVEVGSLLGGRVAAVHVEEGATVVAGQPLVTFETDLVDAQVREQEAVVAQAAAALSRVQKGARSEERARARGEWDNAERERRRLEALRKEGIVAGQDYDTAATRAEVARKSYEELQHGSRAEDVAAARSALDREEQRLAYVRRQREEAVVKAPASGVVQSLDLRPGDLVPANRPVARVLEPSQLWVRVYVPEPRLGLVRVGQEAAVTVDTFRGREFRGRVVEIRDRAEYTPRNIQTVDQRSEQVFGVKVAVDPAPELKPGMAALVRLAP